MKKKDFDILSKALKKYKEIKSTYPKVCYSDDVQLQYKTMSKDPSDDKDILPIPSYQLYQDMVNSIFGNSVINIKPDFDNKVIGTLKYPAEFLSFKKNFESRLIRLRDRFSGTSSFNNLIKTIEQVADSKNWEGAYAELVAYDVMSNDYLSKAIELNNTLSVSESFAGELGGKETNEDGFINEYNLYFDVKILADTVGGLLKGIIEEAIIKAHQDSNCSILPEYPLDDDEADYQINRRQLMEELRDYLIVNKPSGNRGKVCMRSSVLPHLSFRIMWGGGINSSIGTYNPYRHAEECKHLILKRYTKKFMKNNPFFLVMVNFPWYNSRINSFINADEVFYRSLSRRTFCEYKHLQTKMSDIVPKYIGPETAFEVSNYLSGIIFIDDLSIKEDRYSCHIYMNPNAKHKLKHGDLYLQQIIAFGDKRGVLDDMENDNY